MKAIANELTRYIKDGEGMTTVEYYGSRHTGGLTVVAPITRLGNAVGNSINKIQNTIEPQ